MDLTHIKQGDRLLLVQPADRNRQGATTHKYDGIVTKVGRLYLHVGLAEDVEKGRENSVFRWKISRTTGLESSNCQPVRAFTNIAAWKEYQQRKDKEREAYRLASKVSLRDMARLTDGQLLALTAALKITCDAEKADQ